MSYSGPVGGDDEWLWTSEETTKEQLWNPVGFLGITCFQEFHGNISPIFLAKNHRNYTQERSVPKTDFGGHLVIFYWILMHPFSVLWLIYCEYVGTLIFNRWQLAHTIKVLDVWPQGRRFRSKEWDSRFPKPFQKVWLHWNIQAVQMD